MELQIANQLSLPSYYGPFSAFGPRVTWPNYWWVNGLMMGMDILWSATNLNSNYMQLVGGIHTPLINMSSSVGMMKIPKYGKNKCSKPPTRYTIFCVLIILFERPAFLATPGSFWLKLWVDVRPAPVSSPQQGSHRLISKDFTSSRW